MSAPSLAETLPDDGGRLFEAVEVAQWFDRDRDRGVVLVGSAAVRFYEVSLLPNGSERPVRDLDFLVDDLFSLDVEGATAAGWDFAHYHSGENGGEAYAAAVHRATGVKADIFKNDPRLMPEAPQIALRAGDSGTEIGITTIERQIIHMVHDLTGRVNDGTGFGSNEKILSSINSLMGFEQTNHVELQRLWEIVSGPSEDPVSFDKHLASILERAETQTRARQSKVGHIAHLLFRKCQECDPPPDVKLISDARAAATMLWGEWRFNRRTLAK